MVKRYHIRLHSSFIFTHSVVLLALMALCLVAAPSYATTAESTKAMVSRSMMKTPMLFERNIGQAHEDIDFISRGFGYSVGLTEGGVASIRLNKAGKGGFLRIKPMGTGTSTAKGADKHPAKFNYYRGNDKSKWVTGAESYRKVRYSEIYPGVDLVYYGNQKRLEYDFVVSPGVDPEVIGLSFEGSEGVSIDEEGNLLLGFDDGEVVFRAPVSYQEKGGKRVEVESAYVVDKDKRVSFSIGAYDKAAPLIIDPILTFSTLIGGVNGDFGSDIAIDNNGAIWITGRTLSGNYPVTNGFAYVNGDDVIITKLSPAGALLFSTIMGGEDDDNGNGIAIDGGGNAWVTGQTISANFPVTNFTTNNGGFDVFVTRLSSTGALLFSTYIGGHSSDQGKDIVVDSAGNAWVTGKTNEDLVLPVKNYPVTNGFPHSGGEDVFVTKLSPVGAMLFSTLIGAGSFDTSNSIAADLAGNIWITGITTDSVPDWPVTDGSTYSGPSDMFLTKLSPAGAIIFSTLLGGLNSDSGQGLAVDGAGAIWITGDTQGPDFPVTDGSTHNGADDIFVTRFSAAGTMLFSTMIGSGSGDESKSIVVDGAGNAWITGRASEDVTIPIVNYPVTDGSAHNGSFDVFVTKLSSAGAMLFSTLLGASGNDIGYGIASDYAGNVWITGKTDDVAIDFPVTDGSTHNGNSDLFMTKFSKPRYSDFNNDGRSDILRRYTPDRRTLVWTMFGSKVALAQWTSMFFNANWTIVGKGDFNKDGKADILWRYKPDGRTLIWFMSGKTVLGAQWTTMFFNINWEIADIGDFNRDGRSDILWRYKPDGRTLVWTMFGSTVALSQWTSQFFNINWEIAGVGDFNGDGRADIFWRYKPDGRTLVWTMNRNMVSASQWTSLFYNTNWAVNNIGDFNNDSKLDILWRYKPDGRTVIWFMSGNVALGALWTSKFLPNSWKVEQLGDFNSDGRTDVLWRYIDGRTLVRFMSGSTVIASQWTSKQYNTNWTVE